MTTTLATTGNAFNPEYVALIQRHVMQSVNRAPSPEEFQLFLATCQRTGLDPLMRQIYCIERRAKKNDQWVSKYETQISIDGARLVAERTGRYEGQVGPLWCGEDAKWYDVWPFNDAPIASKVGIWKTGFREPLWAVAHYAEYVQKSGDGRPTKFWQSMPALMLAKCAESLALRKAFPNDLSGLYTREEMAQADQPTEASYNPPQPAQLPAPEPTDRDEVVKAKLAFLAFASEQTGETIRSWSDALRWWKVQYDEPTTVEEWRASGSALRAEVKSRTTKSTKQAPLSDEYDLIDPKPTNGAAIAVGK